jgi:uncharacterized membrane protein
VITKLLITLLLLVEVYVVGYACLVAFVFTAWMQSDSFALHASEIDWWLEALKRVGMCLLLALAVSGALFYINRLLVRRHYLKWTTFHRYTAYFCFGFITLSALAGTISFLINQPYM